MGMLFEMDKHDYAECSHTFTHPSARSIIIRDGKVAMIHGMKYDYYKFPGGGIEQGEDHAEAMIRKNREETGLVVIPETVREYGLVHRIQKSDSDPTEILVQDNYYCLCNAEETLVSQQLDGYESKEDYRLEFVDPDAAILKNSRDIHDLYNPMMFQREARVLNILIDEGCRSPQPDGQ